MRTFQTIIPAALILFASFAWAQNASESFDKRVFLKEGLSSLTEALNSRTQEALPTDPSCPAGGTEFVQDLAGRTGKVFAAVDAIRDLMSALKPNVQAASVERTRCGSCRQNNVVSPYASASPQEYRVVPECQGRKGETFSVDVTDKSEIKDFTEEILTGKNSEGQRIQRACPDPCAYYVTTAQTDMANGKTHVTLTVQCGPPRARSVFSAAYEFRGGLIHQWSCSK
jgi:hypothetical protein